MKSADRAQIIVPSWHVDVLREREQRIKDGKARFLSVSEAKRAVRKRIALKGLGDIDASHQPPALAENKEITEGMNNE